MLSCLSIWDTFSLHHCRLSSPDGEVIDKCKGPPSLFFLYCSALFYTLPSSQYTHTCVGLLLIYSQKSLQPSWKILGILLESGQLEEGWGCKFSIPGLLFFLRLVGGLVVCPADVWWSCSCESIKYGFTWMGCLYGPVGQASEGQRGVYSK